MTVAIAGLGTALPPYRVTRAASVAWLTRALADHPSAARLAERVASGAGIETRWSCVPDFAHAGEPTLLGVRSPSTAARMAAYREHAPPLAAEAARKALESAGVPASRVTHLVVVSCTGFYAPGVDVDLVDRLGLAPEVERTTVGFMGCYAAFNGLRVARQAVESRIGAYALVVCVELCSLHFRPDPSADNVVANSLFGDGAAAALVADVPDGLVELGRSATRLDARTRRDMGWEIGDEGFRMTLSSYVPQLVTAQLADFVAPIAGRATESWCVHPGGRAVLDHVEDALGLSPAALCGSRGVLRDVGNVSSATVLFVLEREIERLRDRQRGVMLGFGPGLTLEGLAFTRSVRSERKAVAESRAAALR